MKHGIGQLTKTGDAKVWRLEIEFTDYQDPLRKEIVVAFVEAIPDMRQPKSLYVFYDHSEIYTRRKKTDRFHKDQEMEYHLSKQFKQDLYECARGAWWVYFFGHAGDIPHSIKHWSERLKEKNAARTTEMPKILQ
jgi:hypothetical protein